MSYDLDQTADFMKLTDAMRDLIVGDTFKVSIENNPSVGFFYELIENQDGDYLDISEQMINHSDHTMILGAPTVAEYTVKVIGAGEGNISFEPHVRPDLNLYKPTLSFDFIAHWSGTDVSVTSYKNQFGLLVTSF